MRLWQPLEVAGVCFGVWGFHLCVLFSGDDPLVRFVYLSPQAQLCPLDVAPCVGEALKARNKEKEAKFVKVQKEEEQHWGEQ